VALSFVRQASDLAEVRALMEAQGRVVPLIAKIEKPEAVDNLKAIIERCEGIMVARGDLGVELGSEKVPLVQKRAIRLANERGKLVITATQMLDSMIRSPRPTRAEAADVANAVLDTTDVVMLSGETASGRYPVEAVKMMDAIVRTTEREDRYWREHSDLDLGSTTNAIARGGGGLLQEHAGHAGHRDVHDLRGHRPAGQRLPAAGADHRPDAESGDLPGAGDVLGRDAGAVHAVERGGPQHLPGRRPPAAELGAPGPGGPLRPDPGVPRSKITSP
jgi:hypothetical protein